MEQVTAAIVNLAVQFPWLATVIFVMGIMRLVFKPLMALAHNVVEATPSKNDDTILAKIESNVVFKVLAFLIDYVGSIKIKK